MGHVFIAQVAIGNGSDVGGGTQLIPGADPNPADIGIQMHVLMWLAQADPPAAQMLCSALRQAIDQDRVWVYYRRAPLVPVLRQADMKAVGCDVQLPPSRSQTALQGQEIWLSASDIADIDDQATIVLKAPGGKRIEAQAAPLKAIVGAMVDLLTDPRRAARLTPGGFCK